MSGIITLFLPETLGKRMPSTLEDAIYMLPEEFDDQTKEISLLTASMGDHSSDSEGSENSADNESSKQSCQPC